MDGTDGKAEEEIASVFDRGSQRAPAYSVEQDRAVNRGGRNPTLRPIGDINSDVTWLQRVSDLHGHQVRVGYGVDGPQASIEPRSSLEYVDRTCESVVQYILPFGPIWFDDGDLLGDHHTLPAESVHYRLSLLSMDDLAPVLSLIGYERVVVDDAQISFLLSYVQISTIDLSVFGESFYRQDRVSVAPQDRPILHLQRIPVDGNNGVGGASVHGHILEFPAGAVSIVCSLGQGLFGHLLSDIHVCIKVDIRPPFGRVFVDYDPGINGDIEVVFRAVDLLSDDMAVLLKSVVCICPGAGTGRDLLGPIDAAEVIVACGIDGFGKVAYLVAVEFDVVSDREV